MVGRRGGGDAPQAPGGSPPHEMEECGMKRTGAVIAAAGLSSRMGAFKPLLPFGEFSVAGHLVAMLESGTCGPDCRGDRIPGEELELELADSGFY